MRLILASASPRRRALLLQIGIHPDETRDPNIDERPLVGEKPRLYCRRMAEAKACATRLGSDEIILAADTIVALGRRLLGKPTGADGARDFLLRLSGRRHRVMTAVAVRTSSQLVVKDVMTVLKMKRLTKSEIEAYIDCGEWKGKAGAYGIQGQASAFIPWLRGSFSAVVGLPQAETVELLRACGYFKSREDIGRSPHHC